MLDREIAILVSETRAFLRNERAKRVSEPVADHYEAKGTQVRIGPAEPLAADFLSTREAAEKAIQVPRAD
jgi:hypothetical protein